MCLILLSYHKSRALFSSTSVNRYGNLKKDSSSNKEEPDRSRENLTPSVKEFVIDSLLKKISLLPL